MYLTARRQPGLLPLMTGFSLLVATVLGAGRQPAAAANVMNYGADGNDYFQFTTPAMAFDKASGFMTLVTFAMHVDTDGTLEIGGGPVCSNGVYLGPGNWGSLITTLKTPPTTVTRYEVCIGGYTDSSYDNIKSLVAAQGTGSGSMLYKNFQALKNAVPGIDAINDDDEQTYDVTSSTNVANMLGGLGYKFTLAPYTTQSFWVSLKNNITNCDAIYLQCYEGGAGNDPGQWNSAFGHGVVVIPGQESNTANPSTFRTWTVQTGVQGGFYYPDVVFSSTYWSAAVIQANGLAPVSPTGVTLTTEGSRVKLSWDVVPGAISYNVKRATTAGAEVTVANVSTANNSWPASNLFFDATPHSGVTNYYKVSAVNTNGESTNSLEADVSPPVLAAWFKADAITGLASGANVAIWSDSSGRGFSAIQTVLSQRPVYVTGSLNGLPVVRFNGANNQVLTLTRPVQDDFTVFCVFRAMQGAGAAGQFSDSAGLVSANASGTANDFGAGLFANGQVCAGVGNPDSSVSSVPGFNDGQPHVITLKRTKSSGEVDLYADGNFVGSIAGNVNSLNAASKLALGGQATLNSFLSGDLAEIKIYGSAMSDADRQAQEAILFQKWGVPGTSAGVLAYEDFNYPAGSIISGQFGGAGWSNGWVDVSGTASDTLNSGSLPAGGNAPAGFDGRSTGNSVFISNASRSGRWLDCSTNGVFAQAGLLDTNGNIGTNGRTLYVSFLQQPSSVSQFYEFEFHRNDLGDAGRIAGIGNDLANATTVNLRAPATVHTPLALGSTNVSFYVVRIDYKSGNDDVYVYRNPTGATESDNQPALTMLAVADMSFNGISLAAYDNGVTVKNDQIRLGLTWAAVLGNPPAFIIQPTNQTLYAGQSLTLAAVAQASQPLTYQWYAGAVPLAGQTNSSLTLASVQLSDAGSYRVVASNALGSVTSLTATLSVQPITVAITSPQTVLVGPGSNLVINASVGGTQPLSLQWFRDGVAISGATASSYSVNGASQFDAGLYVLVASNSYGSVTSSSVSVIPNLGGLLAYEGFGYGASSSDISGSSGGFGWASAWANFAGGSSQTFSNSLLAGNLAPVGYDVHSSAGALSVTNASRKGRFLDCSPTGTFGLHGYVDANGNVGADGKTIYLSFLQQPNGATLFYEMELHCSDLGDSGRMGGIGNDTSDTDVHLRVESPPGGTSTQYDLGAGNTNVNFYVIRIDFKAGNDDVFVYHNPASAIEPTTPTLTVSNAADMSFDGISLAAYVNNRTAIFDEIRLGMTWPDVIGTTTSKLQIVQRKNNTSQLRLAGSPNYTFGMQAATNVTGPWATVGSVPVSSLGVGQFSEINGSDRRFYRATNAATWTAPPSPDVVFDDFEQATYGAWVNTGTAFGAGPAQGTLPNQQAVTGYAGSGFVDSYHGSDTSTGTLTSPPFVIAKSLINFLIGGGSIPGQECMNLIISNVVVKTATGGNAENLSPQQWDVSAYLGQTATLQIVDTATGSWGHINVDQIVFTDSAVPSLSRPMMLTNSVLNLPVQNSAALRRVTVTVAGQPVRDFNIRLATGGTPDWWSFLDISAFTNQPATLSVSSLTSATDGFYAIFETNGLADATNLYQETLRPQLHFSTKRGWLNDANGMFYNLGKYNLYYQHDPFSWDGAGQKWWGHAISPDMVNWTEIKEGLYDHTYGDDVYSGSAIVDAANTGSFKTGTNDVIVAAFYSTARGECIAYSNDGGLTYVDYTNNPVATHTGQGRDPHMLWYAPSNYWVMAVYDDAGGNGVQFYTTPDFRHWTFRSKIYNGFFECPDMFQLPVDGNVTNKMWLLCDASTGYQLGQFDGAVFTPSTSKLPGNSGSAYYASQTFTSMAPGDKRVVRIGWAQISTPGMPFNQMMYFPTELNLRTTTNGVQLCSTPVAEITNNAINVYAWTNLSLVAGNNPLTGIRGSLFDLKAQFTARSAQTLTFAFQNVTVTYNVSAQQISCNGDTQSLSPVGGIVQLEIVVDRDTVEIFGNNGQLYMPLPASNSSGNSLVSLTCTGGNATFGSLVVYQLKSIWTGLSH